MKGEPVLTAAGLSGFVMAVFAMAVAMGWVQLSPEQMGALQAVVIPLAIFVVPFLSAVWARNKVTPIECPQTPEGQPAVLLPKAQAQAMGLDMGGQRR